jgi:hypothetical protein
VYNLYCIFKFTGHLNASFRRSLTSFIVFSFEDINPQRLVLRDVDAYQWTGIILTPVVPMVPNEGFSFKFKVEFKFERRG